MPLRAGPALLLLAVALASTPAAAGVGATDFGGHRVELPAPARRVVCLIESALSGLYMLGAGEQVVGVPRAALDASVRPFYEKLDPRIRAGRLPSPGSWDFVSIEQVITLQPDLVIIWSSQREAIEALRARAIAVFAVYLRSFADVELEILALGALTGHDARARELVELSRRELSAVEDRLRGVPGEGRAAAYFAWAQGDLETSCRGSTVDELLRRAGTRNVCDLDAEHARIGLERLLAWNPELVVLWPSARRSAADLLGDSRLAPLRAVRGRRVHALPSPFECDFWTLKYVNAVRRVAAWAYPERFAGMDLEAESQRTLRVLYGAALEPAR